MQMDWSDEFLFLFFFQGNMRDVAAIKCIKKHSLSKSATENLLTEIELLKKLDHEHIVKLKDFEVSKAAAVTKTVHVNVCFLKIHYFFQSLQFSKRGLYSEKRYLYGGA